ncbi:hypothetical protein G9A89_013792 [Geosiphon pyriformis]|nr:hypothetical protein G9A89_013792 [Geosiphon pyriformis]
MTSYYLSKNTTKLPYNASTKPLIKNRRRSSSLLPPSSSSSSSSSSPNSQISWLKVTELLAQRLYTLGFDLVKAFPAQRYNAKVPIGISSLPTFGRNNTLAVVVANTKHFWEIFLAHLASESRKSCGEIDLDPNPIDTYTKSKIPQSVIEILTKFSKVYSNRTKASISSGIDYDIRYSFDKDKSNFVALQLLAHEARLAYYNRLCGLNVHEVAGPWIGLRAVVTFDLDGPESLEFPQHELPNPYSEGDLMLKTELSMILNNIPMVTSRLPSPTLSHPTIASDDSNNSPNSDAEKPERNPLITSSDIRHEWYKWVKLRDLAGGFMTDKQRERYRYSEEQLEYHYTHNKAVLKLALSKRKYEKL